MIDQHRPAAITDSYTKTAIDAIWGFISGKSRRNRLKWRSSPAPAIMLSAFLIAGCDGAFGADAPGRTSNGEIENGANNGEWLRKQISRAKSGAVIDLPAGPYDIYDLEISKSLTLRGPAGDNQAVLYHSGVVDKGLLTPRPGVSLTVENITFRDTNAWDKNGAGIRHEGRDLTIINCNFLRNEDGVLVTGDQKGVITIQNSRFVNNGYGDGQSHGIYVNHSAALRITESHFEGTRIGHHVKSLAEETVLTGNHFDDANGRTSYALDASRGGAVTVTGNTIIQSADSENYHFINYDTSRGGKAVSMTINGNTIINKYNGGVFLRNDTRVAPVINGNTVINEGGKPLKMPKP